MATKDFGGVKVCKKVTWFDIYQDFKNHFPNFKNEVDDYCPYDFATILLYMKNGHRATYNYDTKAISFSV